MPSVYYARNFIPGYYYHLYNRGALKNNIFTDKLDYSTFTKIMIYYLRFPRGTSFSRVNQSNYIMQVTNLQKMHSSFELSAYCLMPNHFHLLVRQNSKSSSTNSVSNFMRRVMITYSLHAKEKYDRSGALFEGRYKNVLVDSDAQLIHLTRYIHLNPLKLAKYASYELARRYPYSSYHYYLGEKNIPNWLSTHEVMKLFSFSSKRYKIFVETKSRDYKLTNRIRID